MLVGLRARVPLESGMSIWNARMLARDSLGVTQEEFSRAFKASPMKRATLRGLRRNAAVAPGKIGSPEALMAFRARAAGESDGRVLEELESALDPTGG